MSEHTPTQDGTTPESTGAGSSAGQVDPGHEAAARTPRRRRSASRAAGPPQTSGSAATDGAPAPAAAEPAAPSPLDAPTEPARPTPTETTPAQDTSVQSPSARSAAPEPTPTEASADGGGASDSAAASSETAGAAAPRARTRRRAATRPAGRPDPVQTIPAPEPGTAPTGTAEEASLDHPGPAPDSEPETAPAGGDGPAPRKRAPRKRAPARSRSTTAAEEAASGTGGTEQDAGQPRAGEPEESREVTWAGPGDTGSRRGRRSRPTGRVADPFAPVDPEPAPARTSSEDDLSAAVRAVFDQAGGTADGPGADRAAEEPTEDVDGQDEDDVDAVAAAESADDGSEDDGSDIDSDDDGSEDDGSEDDGADDDSSDDDGSDGDGTSRNRRRRRRGGRRRRRSGSDGDRADHGGAAEDRDAEDAPAGSRAEGSEDARPDAGAEDAGDAAEDSEDDGGSGEGGRRRRRRRRRRGEDSSAAEDDPSDTVTRVREPRRKRERSGSDQITGIEGSTRLEAKRQRRRDGRQSGRRRTPILSEAEFLARREAVERTMIIRQGEDLSQLAVLEDGVLVEHYVDRESATSLIGNVYLARVQNVLPSMEAAFVDIGRGRNAVLYAGEVDWDAHGADKHGRQIEKVLKSGQTVLVQVTKDPVGAKGARLTNHISIPGRYVVYSPGGHLSGISRKLPETERKRLKDILSDLVGEQASVIVRTAAEGASEEELVRDVNRLKAQWEAIEKKIRSNTAPQLLHAEPDLTLRIVRDLFTEDFATLVVDGNGRDTDAHDTVTDYVGHVAPHLADRLQRWDREEKGDVFAAHRLDEQIAKALDRKVFLPSGGSLIIDRTEAMTVIDVNTGKFTGSGGNLETTVTSNNLEAAEEIVRQLRLRDVGGIIVIDFIDMVLPSNRDLLLRRLVECLGRDRTRHQVAEVTSLGLVQMTRKKIGTGLAEAFTGTCEHCAGLGYHTHEMPVETQSQADGGERSARKGRSSRNKGGNKGGANGSGATEAKEPPRRNGGPQDIAAAMAAKEHAAGQEQVAAREPAGEPEEVAAGEATVQVPVGEQARVEVPTTDQPQVEVAVSDQAEVPVVLPDAVPAPEEPAGLVVQEEALEVAAAEPVGEPVPGEAAGSASEESGSAGSASEEPGSAGSASEPDQRTDDV